MSSDQAEEKKQTLAIYSNCMTIRRWLKKNKIDTIPKIAQFVVGLDINNSFPFTADVDWSRVYVPSAHFGDTTNAFAQLAQSLSFCKQEIAQIQLIIMDNNASVEDGMRNVDRCKLNIVLACCTDWETVEAVRKNVEQAKRDNPTKLIRFDYVNPDNSKLKQLALNVANGDPNAKAYDIVDVIMKKIRDGAIALQYMADEGITVTEADYNKACEQLKTIII